MSFLINDYSHYHFIGVGGIGMSALAQMLKRSGHVVSGSDVKPGTITKALSQIGVRVYEGHRATHVLGADCVVYSSSIKPENPEFKEARAKGLPTKHRSQVLAALSKDKHTIAVSGTHGKTTTTALLGWIFEHAQRNPTVIVGGNVGQFGGNLLMGSGEEMILEADESDASFLEYSPNQIILTNIDEDHLDFFKGIDDIRDKYREFLMRLKPHGRWFGWGDCGYLRQLIREDARGMSYGIHAECHYRATEIKTKREAGVTFQLNRGDQALGQIELSLLGQHNALNATGAAALALERGIEFQVIQEALRTYAGAARRFDIQLKTDDLTVIDDYAHHPTEVEVTISAARAYSDRRLVVVFQPHRFSRTQAFMNDFSKCFKEAREVIVTDVYAAGESPIQGVSGEVLSRAIAKPKKKSYAKRCDVLQHVTSRLKKGDIVLFMGAGDISQVARELAQVKRDHSQS